MWRGMKILHSVRHHSMQPWSLDGRPPAPGLQVHSKLLCNAGCCWGALLTLAAVDPTPTATAVVPAAPLTSCCRASAAPGPSSLRTSPTNTSKYCWA